MIILSPFTSFYFSIHNRERKNTTELFLKTRDPIFVFIVVITMSHMYKIRLRSNVKGRLEKKWTEYVIQTVNRLNAHTLASFRSFKQR